MDKAVSDYLEAFEANGGKPSPLGCYQGGPGCIFGIPYRTGGLVDYIVEGFAGPHDYLNHPVFYTPEGTLRSLTGLGRIYGAFRNATNVILAAPIAIPALVPDELRYLAWVSDQ